MEWVARREGARSNADAAEDGSIESRISLSRLDLEKSTPLSRWPRDRQSLDHRRLSRSPAPSFFYLYFICFFLLFSLPLLFSCSLGALCLGLSLALPLARVYFSRSPLRSPSLPTPPFLFLCFCLFLFLPLSVCLSVHLSHFVLCDFRAPRPRRAPLVTASVLPLSQSRSRSPRVLVV